MGNGYKKHKGIGKTFNNNYRFIKILGLLIIVTILIRILPVGQVTYGANGDSNSTDELFRVNAVLYDYKSDSELYSKSGEIDNRYNAGKNINHYAFEGFNKKVAEYYKSNSMRYPLYFGDFNSGKPGSATYDFKWAANRANRNAGYTVAVTGLVDSTLLNNQITKNGKVLPYFDENFLLNTKSGSYNRSIGSVTKTTFPFRQTYVKGIEYYEFDSKDGRDNVWLSGDTLNYSDDKNKYGVKDARNEMAGGEDGYGFFPFNNATELNGSKSKLNFAFGTRLDINFTIPMGGTLKNNAGSYEDIIFEFTGDDDVWVFIDGQLVLDMGGQHSRTHGIINFNKNKFYSQVDNVVSVNSELTDKPKTGDKVKLGDILDFTDPTKEHTLTMFYMERGMIESNLKVRFNFINTNVLSVDKSVDSTEVNNGLQDKVSEVISKEDFDFNISKIENGITSDVANTEYQKNGYTNDTHRTDSKGGFSLKDKNEALFINVFDENDSFRIKENIDEKYSSTIKLIRDSEEISKISGNDTGTVKVVNNKKTEGINKVQFINKVNTGTINISKNVTDYIKNNRPDYGKDVFTFNIKLKNVLGDSSDTEYKNYNLSYSINGDNKATHIADNGIIKIRAGEEATIYGVPIGTNYIIEEINVPDGYKIEDTVNNESQVKNGNNQVEFTNGADKEVYQLTLVKEIDEKYYKPDDAFSNNETYEGLTDVEQSFVFTIKQYDKPSSNKNRKLMNTFYEVISFNKGDVLKKERVIKNLTKGYYEVSEDTTWSWKYDFERVSVSPAGISSASNKKALVCDIDLGYSIKNNPTVTFENSKKYKDKKHDDVPEGDTDIESNKLTLKNKN